MTIMDQMSQLLRRQQHHYNKERDIEASSIVSCHKYKSQFHGIKGRYDLEAKKNLSSYAHKHLFQVALGNSESLSHKLESDGITHIIWPTGKEQKAHNSHYIKCGDRCNCLFRIMYDCQCKHELAISPVFVIESWNARHYSNKTFHDINPSLLINSLYVNNEVMCTNVNKNILHPNEVIDISGSQIEDVSEQKLCVPTERISYTELHNTASELCRVVSDDQKASKLTYIKLKEWIQRLRNNEDFEITFQKSVLDVEINQDENKNMMPLSSTVSSTNSQKLGKRYKSFRERNLSVFDKRNTNQDEVHTRPKKNLSIILVGCVICLNVQNGAVKN